MPIQDDDSDGPPVCLQALCGNGESYLVRPTDEPHGDDRWELTLESDRQTTQQLGRFGDAVDAQLHAQQHHNTTSP